jgi:MoxR-like ATPase
VRTLEDQLAAYPAIEALHSLRKDSELLASLRVEYHSLARKCSDVEQRALHIELSGREMEQLKVEADALRVLNDELRSELQTHKEALEHKTGERFPELSRIDRTHRPLPSEHIAFPSAAGLLQRLTKHVRQYAASRTPQLFYSDQTIRAFVAGLAASKLSILQGLSGTGKTSLPRVFIEAIGGEYATIPVQSSWRDRHELLGYNNDFNKRFSETEFTKAIYRSGFEDQQERIWFILLDEMNLARVEYYFADFLSVLEEPDPARWVVPLMDYNPFTQEGASPKNLLDGRKLKISQNIWFVGTANQDESTFEITDKVYDRAQVLDFRTRQPEFSPEENPTPKYLSITALQRAFDAAIRQSGYRLNNEEWKYIEAIDDCLRDRLDLSFGSRIKLQMDKFVPVFVACGGRKEEAVDLQIARKVLRKLVNRFDAGLPDALKELENTLASKPAGWQELESSLEIIDRKIVKTRASA